MTHIPETQLSLYAGGELDASDASVTAQHLEQCVACRKKADEFRLAAEWLKSVAAEPDAGQIYTLRESVLQSVPQKRSRKPFWWMAAAAAALALIFFVVLLLRPAQKDSSVAVALPPLLTSRGSVTPLVLPSRDWQGAVTTPRRAPKKSAPRLTLVATNNEDTPVVQVKTSDPNVVILWVVGGGSEQERKNNE
jgi:anti-sigma factor RsiW